MWACTCIHFTNGGAHRFAFLKPMYSASGFTLMSRRKARAVESVAFCKLCSKHGDRLRATRTSFLQGVRKFQWKKERRLWRTAKRICTRRSFSWTIADENSQQKNYKEHKTPESDNVCFVGAGWGSRVSRLLDQDLAYMMGRHVSWVFGAERRHGCLPWSNVQQHAQMSNFHEHDWETTQEIRNNSWIHQSCMHACVCLLHRKTNIFMPRDSTLLSSWCWNQCAVHIILRPKKKVLINFKTCFSRIVVGKKVVNQNWKSKSLRWSFLHSFYKADKFSLGL